MAAQDGDIHKTLIGFVPTPTSLANLLQNQFRVLTNINVISHHHPSIMIYDSKNPINSLFLCEIRLLPPSHLFNMYKVQRRVSDCS